MGNLGNRLVPLGPQKEGWSQARGQGQLGPCGAPEGPAVLPCSALPHRLLSRREKRRPPRRRAGPRAQLWVTGVIYSEILRVFQKLYFVLPPPERT